MSHQAQKGFCGIFVGNPQHQKGYLMYIPTTINIISSYDIAFDANVSSALAYISQLYAEAMNMHPSVSYIPSDTSLREKTGDTIIFTQFEAGYLLSETCDNAESCDRYDDYSIMPPLISKEEMDAMDSDDDSEDKTMSMDMSEHIHDGSKYHLIIKRKEELYKIFDCIK